MMSDIDIMFFKDRATEILELRQAVKERERLIDAEKAKVETASGLISKANEKADKMQEKLTAMCHCVNVLATYGLVQSSPKRCKELLIGLKKDIEKCVRVNDIHFNSEGVAE